MKRTRGGRGLITWLVGGLAIAAVSVACLAPPASADDWFPHPANAQWTYNWSNPKYNPSGTAEAVTVQSEAETGGCGWQLAWTGNTQVPLGSGSGSTVISEPDNGTICFSDGAQGLVNTYWSGDPAPYDEPILCSSSGSCANSLGSTLFNVIWGSRAPLLAEPLLSGTSWDSTGGGSGNVGSINDYLGLQTIKVPAYPAGVLAAAVRSRIGIQGTPGDAFGSGTRITWWVYGVGPVKVQFSAENGTTTTAQLVSTNLRARRPPPDTNYFPLRVGMNETYRWTNRKHLQTPQVEKVSVASDVNRTARLEVQSVSGPLQAIGSYDVALRADGLSTIDVSESASSLSKQPALGRGLHFFTPVDLMTYGFNPVLPPYPIAGTVIRSGNVRDWRMYGVVGSTKVIGVRRVKVPAGTFAALELRSVLTQQGHRYGSGTRTMWFAPGRGLVKLVFNHRDGSVSTVELIR